MVAVLGVVAVAEDRNRLAERCPDVVEVDAGGHDADDHLERCGLRDLDLLDLESVLGLAFALLADDPGGHRLRQRAGLHIEIRDFGYVNCHVSSTPDSFRKGRGRVSPRKRRARRQEPVRRRDYLRESTMEASEKPQLQTRRRARRDRSRARRPDRDRGPDASRTSAPPELVRERAQAGTAGVRDGPQRDRDRRARPRLRGDRRERRLRAARARSRAGRARRAKLGGTLAGERRGDRRAARRGLRRRRLGSGADQEIVAEDTREQLEAISQRC